MKKVVLFVFMLLQLWACGQVKYREVLSLADEFVSSLDNDYEQLRQALAAHYSDDGRVKQVYRCHAGTIMIDCRN